MNKRIKELAEQVYGSAHHDDFKFAELIVRECIEVFGSVAAEVERDITMQMVETLPIRVAIRLKNLLELNDEQAN